MEGALVVNNKKKHMKRKIIQQISALKPKPDATPD